jgi:aminoglycoside phosphotransferase (APT) family kinase protein
MTPTFVEELTQFVSSLEWAGRSALVAPLSWVVSTNGDTQVDDNVILFGFSDARRDPVLAVKVPRLREPNRTLQNEFALLSQLWETLGAEARSLVPEPIALASLRDQPALLLSYVPGEVARGRGSRSVWRNAGAALSLAVEAARALRLIHQQTARPLADHERTESDLESRARHFGEAFALTRDERRALDELVSFARSAAASATHEVMNQGDFWSGNLIRPRRRGGLVILDWQFARWSADASLDVYLFLTDGALDSVSDAPAVERARHASRRLTEWQLDLIPAYLEAYGEPSGYMLLPLRLGMMACCVEKAVRSTLAFGHPHPHDAVWRALFTELTGAA